MRLLSLNVSNFGSYDNLKFDFENLGLALIHGPTGSGKSTIFDAACWVLYGVTAKGGSVDEVRSWNSEEPTLGELYVETSEKSLIVVTRLRGTKSDLYWREASSSGVQETKHRGKDLSDTQKLLMERLGISENLYLTGAYFSEFSETARFFMAKPNERRNILERVANLALPAKLAARASLERKAERELLGNLRPVADRTSGKLYQLRESKVQSKAAAKAWEEKQKEIIHEAIVRGDAFESEKESKIEALKTKADHYEATKEQRKEQLLEKIDKLAGKVRSEEELTAKVSECKEEIARLASERCPTCGGAANSKAMNKARDALDKAKEEYNKNTALQVGLDSLLESAENFDDVNPYLEKIEEAEKSTNYYLDQVVVETNKINPFVEQIQQLELDIATCEVELKQYNDKIKLVEARIAGLSHLYALSFELRGALIQKAIQEIEAKTNRYLEKYFDAEIKVTFSAKDADKLDVQIQKSGHDCVYSQLSKGQRGLLKLAFVVAVMEAASSESGQHFENMFFDEALDGLDGDLKVKAFSLFEELSQNHESIVVIDHSVELQQMFGKRFQVSMESDVSRIDEEQS